MCSLTNCERFDLRTVCVLMLTGHQIVDTVTRWQVFAGPFEIWGVLVTSRFDASITICCVDPSDVNLYHITKVESYFPESGTSHDEKLHCFLACLSSDWC